MSEQRRDVLVRLVNEHGRVGLAELAEATGVSEMTVRRDLDDLTERGLLRRVRGGAVSLEAAASSDGKPNPPARTPARTPGHSQTRRREDAGSTARRGDLAAALAATAPPGPRPTAEPGRLVAVGGVVAEQIPPGATVLLDAGPGALEVATHLAGRAHSGPVTVVVTGLSEAAVLTGRPGVRLVVLGGEPRNGEPGLLGPTALAALGDLYLDVLVLTPAAVDAGTGCWARSPDAAALARTALARTDRTVAVAADGVLGRRSLVHLAPLTALAQLVTPGDQDLTALPVLGAAREVGVEVLLA